MSSLNTLAVPRLGAEEGVGRMKEETNTKTPQSRALIQWLDYPDHGPALSGGGRQDGKKRSKQTNERDHPEPITERGGVGRTKNKQTKKRSNQTAQSNKKRPKP